MKNIILTSIIGLLFCLNSNAQYYSVKTSVNPVTLCNSSTVTSINLDIKCEGECKVIIEFKNNSGNWSYQTTESSDSYGNVRYVGTGLKLNKTYTYRTYVYRKGTRVSRYDISSSDYKNHSVYTKKICE